MDVLEVSNPLWAVFENVESIDREVDPDMHLAAYSSFEIEQRGYAAQSYLLDAKAYGLPQHRRRIYIICLDFHNKQLSVSANDFFASVKVLLRKLYVPALTQDRQAKLSKEAEEPPKSTKNANWTGLHMSIAEKRGIQWPVEIPASVKDSPWFQVLTERAQEVVGFCCDERERLGRAIDYADVYHSANRFASSVITSVTMAILASLRFATESEEEEVEDIEGMVADMTLPQHEF
ncbi:Uncharacterized protein SCF082_LOCUS21614 [Durusdinium trenchii]|uniref:Uncharacterized protein n=1 Tax=Durusdinium trenchii TaxID=1381693 RepID=A0ABP0LAJ3_9DINO